MRTFSITTKIALTFILAHFLLLGCEEELPSQVTPSTKDNPAKFNPTTPAPLASENTKPVVSKIQKAYFAGGCFWCVESTLESINGINEVISGYTGGHTINPTYQQVCQGQGNHYEAVEVQFDPTVISYDKLITAFWRLIDPTDPSGSFVDRGMQYASAIFYANASQHTIATKSKQALTDSHKFSNPIATKILALDVFYPAETYHQNYYKKKPAHYQRYRQGSGRDQYIAKTWGTKHNH